jgi:hypothetical protein
MKTCSVVGCNAPIFGKSVCKYHYPKASLKSKKSFSNKVLKHIEIPDKDISKKREAAERQKNLFKKIWYSREHKSEVSGTYLGKPISSLYFHHILEKRNYKQAAYDEENIIILTPEEHATVELNKYKYEEINRRRELLLTKYKIP